MKVSISQLLIYISIFFAFANISFPSMARDTGDPKEKKCTNSTEIITSNSITIANYNVVLTVEMRRSLKCRSRWVRAYVPLGTKLYLKDDSGKKYVEYTAQVNGWNYSNMDDLATLVQACAKYPGNTQELCTKFK